MADLNLEVWELYKDVPRRCFNSRVPFVMQVARDHTIVPSESINMLSPGGTSSKLIRIAKYQDFLRACETHVASTGGRALFDRLDVFVMPYMPLDDAFLLHQLITNPDPMPTTYTDAVQMLQNELEGHVDDPMVEEEEEKRGLLPMPQFDMSIDFLVCNYQVLWSKSKAKCMLDFVSEPMLQLVESAGICDQILGNDDSDEESDRLDAIIEEARRQLIFSMYQSGVSDPDLHHVIVTMYPAVHNAIYDECPHCGAGLHFNDVVNSPGTEIRLQSSLVFLGYQEGYVYPAIEDAEYNLMMTEGQAEYHYYSVKTKQEFSAAREVMKTSLATLIHRIVLARQRLSLMGVTN